METLTEKKKKKSRSVLLWILIVLAPLIAGWLIGLISGTSPLKLDAWNTTWSDENGYYRVIRTMRYYGVPQGMTGFNEITSGNVPFGPYNLFSYIPYYLLSFATAVIYGFTLDGMAALTSLLPGEGIPARIGFYAAGTILALPGGFSTQEILLFTLGLLLPSAYAGKRGRA